MSSNLIYPFTDLFTIIQNYITDVIYQYNVGYIILCNRKKIGKLVIVSYIN